MINAKSLIRHELIGLRVEITNSTNSFHKRIKGLVVDETKNLLIIETESGTKKIQKKGTEFMFTLPDSKKVKVNGNVIEKRPEERVKLKVKKW